MVTEAGIVVAGLARPVDGGGVVPAPSKYSDKFDAGVTVDLNDPSYVVTSDPLGGGYLAPSVPLVGALQAVGGAGYAVSPGIGAHGNPITIPDLSIATVRRFIFDVYFEEHPVPAAAPYPSVTLQMVLIDNALNGFIASAQYTRLELTDQITLQLLKIEAPGVTTPIASVVATPAVINTSLPLVVDLGPTNARLAFGDDVIEGAHGFGALPVLQRFQPIINTNDPSPNPAANSARLLEAYPWL